MGNLQKKEVLKDADDYTDELNTDEEEIFPAQKNTDLQNNEATKQDLLSVASLGKEPVCNNNEWSKSLSNHTLQSTTDKDARVSVKPGKTRRLNYLAQVSVDTANHVITQIQSDFADKKDSQCLPSLLYNTIDNLSEQGLQVEEVLADGNYSSSEALQTLEDNNIVGYIPNFGQYKSLRKGFSYDKGNDCYICSQGKVLGYKSIKASHRNAKMKQYRSSSKDCAACPLKSQCIGKSSFKTIAVTIDKELFEKMHNRLQTPMAKNMKKLRSSTVEPVLGTLVNFLGMRRVNTKGVSLAGKCMMMAAIAYNLKKLMKWQSKKVHTELQHSLQSLIFILAGTFKSYYLITLLIF